MAADQSKDQQTEDLQSRPDSPARRYSRILACVLCQQRKIKCDRTFPCSHCVKANVVCTPSTPAPSRKRRQPNFLLQERITRLEALLEQCATDSPESKDSFKTASDVSGLLPDSVGSLSRTLDSPISNSWDENLPCSESVGKLVVQDGGLKFMDSYMWTILHENLQAMRHIIESSETHDAFSSDSDTLDEDVDLLYGPVSSIRLQDLVPLPVQVLRLWQVFIDRVNPLTKLIHVPTLEPVIMGAVVNHANVPSKFQALLFSIYLASAISLSDKEARTILGLSRDAAIRKFTLGVKTALSSIHFLVNYDMTLLQAMVLYLVSLRGRCNHHAVWVLSGVVIRIAHKMGFHRDGQALNLSPFDTEMRRRIWWQIIMLDSMYATTSGLKPTLLPHGSDTKIPQNVLDADFHPGSTEIRPREGSTDMAFCLMLYETIKFVKNYPLANMEKVVLRDQDAEPGTLEYAACQAALTRFGAATRKFDTVCRELEKRYCDPLAGPVHVLATNIRSFFMKQTDAMFVPMRETPEWGTEVKDANDNMFRIWLCHYESTIWFYETSCHSNFLWSLKCHFHLESFIFLVGQLISRSPVDSFADRSWRLFDRCYNFHEELWDMRKRQHMELSSLILKAWDLRESALLNLGVKFEVPTCVLRLRNPIPNNARVDPNQVSGPSQAIAGDSKENQVFPDISLDMPEQLLESLSAIDWDASNVSQDTNAQNPTPPVFGIFNNYTGW